MRGFDAVVVAFPSGEGAAENEVVMKHLNKPVATGLLNTDEKRTNRFSSDVDE